MYNSIVLSAHDFKLMMLEERLESAYLGLLQVIKDRVIIKFTLNSSEVIDFRKSMRAISLM